jgi:hypothetical protein
MTYLSEQDEEFLEDISELSEHRKNGIIGYLKNKCDAHYIRGIEQGKKDERERIFNLDADDFDRELMLFLKEKRKLKKELAKK